jgi:cobalt/nickel transport system ATP-binding protein
MPKDEKNKLEQVLAHEENHPFAESGPPLLALCEVSFAYQTNMPVLNGCSLSVYAGDRIGITGPNGSGKTTLLWLLVGLLRPTQGTILAFGRPRSREHEFHEVRRRVGLLFQDSDDQLFCPTVLEDVAFGPLNLGKSRAEALAISRKVLEQLQLRGYENRTTYHLSGGEKRLVALATILAMEPEVLLLDEPTTGLDETSRERVIELVKSLPQALVVVSHDRELLDRVTTRRLVLRDGKLHPA